MQEGGGGAGAVGQRGAQNLLERAVQLAPNNVEVLVGLAEWRERDREREGALEAAIGLYEQALGLVLLQRERYTSAKQPSISAKQPSMSAKQPLISAQEPSISEQDACISAKQVSRTDKFEAAKLGTDTLQADKCVADMPDTEQALPDRFEAGKCQADKSQADKSEAQKWQELGTTRYARTQAQQFEADELSGVTTQAGRSGVGKSDADKSVADMCGDRCDADKSHDLTANYSYYYLNTLQRTTNNSGHEGARQLCASQSGGVSHEDGGVSREGGLQGPGEDMMTKNVFTKKLLAIDMHEDLRSKCVFDNVGRGAIRIYI